MHFKNILISFIIYISFYCFVFLSIKLYEFCSFCFVFTKVNCLRLLNNQCNILLSLLHYYYRVFIKYCFFPKNVLIFLNSTSFAAALVFYLSFRGPSMKSGVHTEEKPRGARVRNVFENFRKKT